MTISNVALTVLILAAVIIAGIITYLFARHHLRLRDVAIVLALYLLSLGATILVTVGQAQAEQLGIYAFYSLIAGVLLLFIRLIRDGSGEP